MLKDAKSMKDIQNNRYSEEVESILEEIENEAMNGKSNIILYIGNSEDDKKQLLEKINFLTNKLSFLGFEVARDYKIQWRPLIPNVIHEYLKVEW